MTPRQRLARSVKDTIASMIEWHPVSVTPPDGTITVACLGRRSAVAKYRDGQWFNDKNKPLGFEPDYWMGVRYGQSR